MVSRKFCKATPMVVVPLPVHAQQKLLIFLKHIAWYVKRGNVFQFSMLPNISLFYNSHDWALVNTASGTFKASLTIPTHVEHYWPFKKIGTLRIDYIADVQKKLCTRCTSFLCCYKKKAEESLWTWAPWVIFAPAFNHILKKFCIYRGFSEIFF